MEKKKTKKIFLKSISSIYTCVLLVLAVVLYFFAFTHYEVVDINTASSYDVVISDVEYGSDQAAAWATFDASGVPAYFVFHSRKAANTGDFEKIEELAADNKEVKITFTDYNDWLRLIDFHGRKRVVDIRTDDEVVFDISIYNSRAKTMIVLWSVIATFLFVSAVVNVVIRFKLKI